MVTFFLEQKIVHFWPIYQQPSFARHFWPGSGVINSAEWLSYIGNEILPIYVGIVIGIWKDPYEPSSIMEFSAKGFDYCSNGAVFHGCSMYHSPPNSAWPRNKGWIWPWGKMTEVIRLSILWLIKKYECMVILRDFPDKNSMKIGLVSYFMTPVRGQWKNPPKEMVQHFREIWIGLVKWGVPQKRIVHEHWVGLIFHDPCKRAVKNSSKRNSPTF